MTFSDFRCVVAAIAIWGALPTSAGAQDLQTGLDAYNAGDFSKALNNLQPAAELGDAEAQSTLAEMYLFGYGLQQDYAAGTPNQHRKGMQVLRIALGIYLRTVWVYVWTMPLPCIGIALLANRGTH